MRYLNDEKRGSGGTLRLLSLARPSGLLTGGCMASPSANPNPDYRWNFTHPGNIVRNPGPRS